MAAAANDDGSRSSV